MLGPPVGLSPSRARGVWQLRDRVTSDSRVALASRSHAAWLNLASWDLAFALPLALCTRAAGTAAQEMLFS